MELWVQFLQAATPTKPYMFHCHVLEHEDRGMMGQFAVLAQAAGPADYQFELVGDAERVGGGRVRFGVRLAANGQPVANAEIVSPDFNMSPEGMAHSNVAEPVSRSEDGTQWFEVIPDMGGRWQAVLRASVPGVEGVVRGDLIVRVPE
jgi:hypothetical protein